MTSYDARPRIIVEFDAVLIRGLELARSTCDVMVAPSANSYDAGGAASGKESRANNMLTTCCGAAVSRKMSVGIEAIVCSSLGTEAMVCLSLFWDIGLELELV